MNQDEPTRLTQTGATSWTYEELARLVRDVSLPVVLVDLHRFDQNVRYFAETAARAGKTIRLASKSIRVPALIQRALQVGSPGVRGLMCYSAAEAACLADIGFDDLFIGYPSTDAAGLIAAANAVACGKQIRFTVDSVEHVDQLVETAKSLRLSVPLKICIDVDVSWRTFGFHIGVQRSPLRTEAQLGRLMDDVLSRPELLLSGVLAYEAQIAGVPDLPPAGTHRNRAIEFMKRRSIPDVERKRSRIHQLLSDRGLQLELFNGGGTGSFEDTLHDPHVTEVTIGSGLLQPHLFDRYVKNHCEPAIVFALPVTRCPQPDRITCQGGGFIASGAPGRDRSPVPLLPAGLRTEPREGFGEVQTPFMVPATMRGKLRVGDPVFFRPAKAGEIAERFPEYYLFSDGQVVERSLTYRGMGRCFH